MAYGRLAATFTRSKQMKSIAGLLGLLVFLAIAYFLAGSYIGGIQEKMASKCTPARQALGLCQ